VISIQYQSNQVKQASGFPVSKLLLDYLRQGVIGKDQVAVLLGPRLLCLVAVAEQDFPGDSVLHLLIRVFHLLGCFIASGASENPLGGDDSLVYCRISIMASRPIPTAR